MTVVKISPFNESCSSLILNGLPSMFKHTSKDITFVVTKEWDRDADIHVNDRIGYYPSNGVVVQSDTLTIIHQRYAKSIYNKILNKAVSKYTAGLAVNCWDSYQDVTARTSDILLRPEFGANGEGFILNNSGWELGALNEIFRKFDNGDSSREEFFERLENIHATFSKKDFNRKLLGGHTFVEVIDHVEREVRILTDYKGSPVLFIARNIIEGEFGIPVASSRYLEKEAIFTREEAFKICGKNCDSILECIEELKMPLHSFDLFITKHDKFGFFEASTEFGTTCVPNTFLRSHSKMFIENAYEQALITA